MDCKTRLAPSRKSETPLKTMAARLKFIVAYDGSPFEGWQSQSGGNTIQDHLERAFNKVTGSAIRVHGAGRTDSGVHALGQCAHADLLDRRLTGERWARALNANLPPKIRVLRCRYVSEKFHARFSAKGKLYRYRIWNAEVVMPFEFERVWHITGDFDFRKLGLAAQCFRGRHDFVGFAANRGKPPASTIRTIRSVRVHRAGSLIVLDFEGDGFLYKMVRLMAGSVVDCALGKRSPSELRLQLASGKSPKKPVRHAAPATGLFLVRVRY